MLQICKYRLGINIRPLLSGVTTSTSLTNCLKMSWCLLFHLFSLLLKLVQLLVPHALGVQGQTVREIRLTHNKPLFGSCL